MTVERLVREQRLERVESDVVAAAAELEQARKHLEASARVVEVDPNGAYHLAYDGARKATAAHLRANGLRVRPNVVGAHAVAAVYARAAIDDELGMRLDRMRRRRNRSEYGVTHVEPSEVEAALEDAAALVAAVEASFS